MDAENLLTVSGLKTYFYTDAGVVKAVDNIDLDVKKGETLGIIGESGSGKTMTAYSVLRIVPTPGKIVSGKIFYKGEDLLTMSEAEMQKIRGKEISMSFQDPTTALNPIFTIRDQLIDVIKCHQRVDTKEATEKAIKLLEIVGIPEAETKIWDYPQEFSIGMKQRIAFARAVACEPTLLFADEPTTSLDVTIQAQILDFLRELKKNFNMTLILITHNIGVIYKMADRITVMYAGCTYETANKKTLFREAKHPYTKALLSSVPRLGIKIRDLKIIPGTVPDLISPPSGCRFHPRCKYAKPICKKERPLYEKTEDGSFVACHRWREIETM